MRHTAIVGLLALFGCLVLQALRAVEPVAGVPIFEAELKTTDKSSASSAVEAWHKLIEQGLAPAATALQPQDAVVLLASLKAQINKTLALGNEHPAFDKTAPATLDDFEKLFWTMHVFSNQMTSAGRFLDYAQTLLPTAKKFKPKKNDNTDVTVLQTDWAGIKTEIADLWQRFAERDRDLRVARLNLADKVMTESNDLTERLMAALQLDLDGDLLPQLLAKDKTFPEYQTRKVKETVEHARTMAGRDFIQKSRWLFTGLHWWIRGRYGMGTAADGLLKDPAAIKSHQVMFGLIMPVRTPIPTAPTADEPVPFVDRRHHYLWQFETRQIVRDAKSTTTITNKQFVPTSVSITHLSHFY
ncbi:MAG TPA: hypothetical protein PLN21_14845 [Gemmatales bacterium]|nr:hypothetical protein [Gemmatales bacterium]